MLLSYINNNIENNRVMMDDLADQDWFEESDEIASGSINKPSVFVDDQHFYNPPQQSLHQQNFLNLNVPVDENISYSTNYNQTVAVSTSQFHSQNSQHYLELKGPQNVISVGGHIISNANTFAADHNGNGELQPSSRNNIRGDYGKERTPTPAMAAAPQPRLEPIVDGKCNYNDCMPSTSIAILKPFNQEHSQMCQSQQQQLQHPTYYDQRILPNEQQHIRHSTSNVQNIFYGNHSLSEHQQNQPQLAQFESQAMHLAVSTSSNVNSIYHQNQHLQSFYPTQHSLQQNHHFNSHAISANIHQSSSIQLPSNYQSPPDQLINHNLQPLNASNAIYSNHINQQVQLNIENASAKNIAKKNTKTRRRPSVSNQSANKLDNGFEAKQQTETSTSGLDQVAKSLFNNQKTTTLEFADSQLALEFASLMGRCQQLAEQSANGMDVSSELKIVEERIAACIMRNSTTSAAKTEQQQQYSTYLPLTGQFETPSDISNVSKTFKSAKSRPPRKNQNIPKKSSNAAALKKSNVITPPLQNSTQHFKPQINEPQNDKSRSEMTTTPVQFVAFQPNQSLLNTSCSSSTIYLENNETTKDEKVISVLVPTASSSSNNMIYAKRKMQIIAKEDEKLIAERLAKQKEIRCERLKVNFSKMREQLISPDLNQSFKNKTDAIERLLPYGLLSEPELSQEFINKYDDELQRHKQLMQSRQQSIEQRMCSALFREAICDTHEQSNLLLYLDNEFERRQHENEIAQWNSDYKNEKILNESLPPQLPLTMDWEYNNWDDERYQYVLTPEIIEQKEEEIETDINIKSNSTECNAICNASIAIPRHASVTIRLLQKEQKEFPSARNFKKLTIYI